MFQAQQTRSKHVLFFVVVYSSKLWESTIASSAFSNLKQVWVSHSRRSRRFTTPAVMGPRPGTRNAESNTDVWSFRLVARYTGYEDLEDGYDLRPLQVALDPEAGDKTYAKNATGAGTTVFGKPSTHTEETNKIYAGTEPGPLRNWAPRVWSQSAWRWSRMKMSPGTACAGRSILLANQEHQDECEHSC